MHQVPFAQFPRLRVHQCNLLKARMIVTTYNQHVRLLSSEPFGWFAPPKFTRAWEPTLLWNHYTHRPRRSSGGSERTLLIQCVIDFISADACKPLRSSPG